jgi:hypothetical protein
VIIGVGLHYAEKVYAEPLPTFKKQQQTPTGKKRKQAAIDGESSDDELSRKSAKNVSKKHTAGAGTKGTGYSGSVGEDESGALKAAEAQQLKDDQLRALLYTIRTYMPNPFRPGGARCSDNMIHSSVLCHLKRRFNQIACSLLQSDSITDIHHREKLFAELMDWLLVSECIRSYSTGKPS